MEFDAFTGGVADGGLRTKNDIKILICYMLATLDAPFSKNDMIRVLQETALANYFEINDAFLLCWKWAIWKQPTIKTIS